MEKILNKKWTKIVNHIPGMVIMTNKEGTILFINEVF